MKKRILIPRVRLNEAAERTDRIEKTEPLLEMAYERKEFKLKVDDFAVRIIQNWCLIDYTKYDKRYEKLRGHWKVKLEAHLKNIASHKLKGNNSYETRLKVFKEIWYDEREFATDSYVVNLIISSKFNEEKIPTNSEAYSHVISDCMKETDKMLDVIAKASYNVIDQYVESL